MFSLGIYKMELKRSHSQREEENYVLVTEFQKRIKCHQNIQKKLKRPSSQSLWMLISTCPLKFSEPYFLKYKYLFIGFGRPFGKHVIRTDVIDDSWCSRGLLNGLTSFGEKLIWEIYIYRLIHWELKGQIRKSHFIFIFHSSQFALRLWPHYHMEWPFYRIWS